MEKPKVLTARELRAITLEVSRYDVGGGRVTDRDVEVATKISSVYRARS